MLESLSSSLIWTLIFVYGLFFVLLLKVMKS